MTLVFPVGAFTLGKAFHAAVTAIYQFGRFELRTATRQLLANHEITPLGARAFDILLALIERRDRLVSKDELLDLVWPGLVVEENNLQVQVSALRKILGQEAIATIPGRGYRFTASLTSDGVPAAPLIPWPGNNLPQGITPLKTFLAPIDENGPSIAVLPFVNISDEAANEYFADGIAEELLNVLSKIPGLRVASHTSAFSFKGSKVDIPTVARKLNVSTILEGSVRKSGKRACE
jgi:DNA-binding winged helix-turn-helix (wHTH) protein